MAVLAAAMAINYFDRGALSVAAPLLSKDFALSPVKLGFLLSAFFWSYSVCQMGAGWLMDRVGIKWVYAAGFLTWSLATAATGLLHGFVLLIAMRVLLGIGESVAYPATSIILARTFAEEKRGLANAVIDAASKAGPALSISLGGLAAAAWGWRAMFVGLGLAGCLWLIAWMRIAPASESGPRSIRQRGPGAGELLRHPQFWGTAVAMMTLGYAWFFLLTWLPSYLVNARGFTLRQTALFGAAPYWGMAAASLAAGWISDLWIRRGAAPTRVRRGFIGSGLLLSGGLLMLAAFPKSNAACLALLTASTLSLGLFSSNVWAATQTLAGAEAAGIWTGFQNAIGNFGGILAPVATGFLVARTGSFRLAFVSAGLVLILGFVCYMVLVPQIMPVAWFGGRPGAATAPPEAGNLTVKPASLENP